MIRGVSGGQLKRCTTAEMIVGCGFLSAPGCGKCLPGQENCGCPGISSWPGVQRSHVVPIMPELQLGGPACMTALRCKVGCLTSAAGHARR